MESAKSELITDAMSEKIIETAEKIATTDGASTLTVRRILKELGITNRVFYNRFRNIDEVLAMDEQQERYYDLFCKASQNAGDRLLKVSREERMEAIHYGYQMIDNIKKYGVACAEWASD